MLKTIIILIVVAEFILDIVLTVLNVRASRRPIPVELQGIYDDEKYARQQAYSSENRRVGILSNILSTAFTLGMFAFGGFAWLDEWVRSLTGNLILQTLCFLAVMTLISTFMGLPFRVYRVFSIETRYGFNRTTPLTFVADFFKGLLLNAVITGGLIAALVWIYGYLGEWFWLAAWGVITGFSLFMQLFYSNLIVPLFNKQTPLPEGELRTAIESFAKKVNFTIRDIYIIDGSKRSSKANAYFTGFGPKKRIVLYDTLSEQLTNEEIVAVLAHEIGHCKHHHTLIGTFISMLTTLVMLFIFGLVIDSPAIAAAAGCAEPSFYINLIVFSLLFTPVNIVLDTLGNILSRHHEWQADEFARIHGVGDEIASSLKKMTAHCLSNLTPHPLVVFLEYSHPTLLDRVRHLCVKD